MSITTINNDVAIVDRGQIRAIYGRSTAPRQIILLPLPKACTRRPRQSMRSMDKRAELMAILH